MRWLGMAAAFMTLAAVILNTIWFTRQGLSLGSFLALTWPAALGAFGVLAGAMVLGFVSVRLMLRADAESERAAARRSDERSGPGRRGRSGPEGPRRRIRRNRVDDDEQGMPRCMTWTQAN